MTDHYLELEQEVLQLRASLTAVSAEKLELQERLDAERRKPSDEYYVACAIAGRVEAENQVAEVSRRLAQVTRALESIANSSCCGGCQEAALVAKAALEKQI